MADEHEVGVPQRFQNVAEWHTYGEWQMHPPRRLPVGPREDVLQHPAVGETKEIEKLLLESADPKSKAEPKTKTESKTESELKTRLLTRQHHGEKLQTDPLLAKRHECTQKTEPTVPPSQRSLLL